MQCVCKTNYGLIGNIFLSLIFLSNMFCSYFFPKLMGRFTHGTVRANVFFSNNFNVFLKERNKKASLLKDLSFIKYLNYITHEGLQEFIKASHETMNMYVHIHKI